MSVTLPGGYCWGCLPVSRACCTIVSQVPGHAACCRVQAQLVQLSLAWIAQHLQLDMRQPAAGALHSDTESEETRALYAVSSCTKEAWSPDVP